MGFIRNAINKGKQLLGFGAKPTVVGEDARAAVSTSALTVYSNPWYRRTTTAIRRFRREANTNYRHVSMEISETDQRIVAMLGHKAWRSLRVGEHAGTTYDVGMNKVKRNVRALPTKRERRAAMRAFREHLNKVGI